MGAVDPISNYGIFPYLGHFCKQFQRHGYRFAVVAFLAVTAACQTVPKGSFCQIAQPVRLSQSAIDSLSDAEVKALLAHNRKGQRLCQWRP
jgi:hypothetical protein